MKKTISLLLALLFTTLCGCYKEERGDLISHGLDIIALMDEIAESDICKDVFSADDESLELIKQAGTGDYSSPTAVYEIKLSSDTLEALTDYEGDASLSDNLQNYLNDKATLAVSNYINAQAGVSVIAAASLCSVQTPFYCKDLTSDTLYLYLFESGFPIIVSFVASEKSAVYASGNFIMNTDFNTESEASISKYLSSLGASVSKIK